VLLFCGLIAIGSWINSWLGLAVFIVLLSARSGGGSAAR
jgi:hypothetical protein